MGRLRDDVSLLRVMRGEVKVKRIGAMNWGYNIGVEMAKLPKGIWCFGIAKTGG